MDKRKEELERKRQKLAEIRKAKEERKATTDTGSSKTLDLLGVTKERKDVEDLVKSLVGDERSAGDGEKGVGGSGAFGQSDAEASPFPHGEQSRPESAAAVEQVILKPAKFDVVELVLFDLPPKERVFYNKEAQTTETSFGETETEEEPANHSAEEAPQKKTTEVQASEEREESKPDPIVNRELTEEEKSKIIESDVFSSFFSNTAKLVERALTNKFDIARDYTSTLVDDMSGKTGSINLVGKFFDERWSKNRSVTDVGWSPKYPELSLASYNKNLLASNEPDGVVLVWNVHLPNRPEFVFHSQSVVTTCMFSRFHPNLIVGGTYSGQILLWDTRAKSSPVQKTPLSSTGHTHPVYSLAMVGTQNAHNLISASTDGLLCTWQLDMLAVPQDQLELTSPAQNKAEEVAVTTLGFPENETSFFWVGTEEGSVYQGSRFDRAGSKAGISTSEIYRGHFGPLTGLHFHPLNGPSDFSDLFLTSSMDWTVKLWRAKTNSKAASGLNEVRPLYSFDEADDYVYDVKWSPVHPSVFAAIDGTGSLQLWNLNVNTEVPIARVAVGNGTRALNKLQWDKEGKNIIIGSSDGNVYLYDIGELATPRQDEASIFQRTLKELDSAKQ